MQDPTPTPTPAESPTPTPDPELERLKREQAIADAEKAKSQAEKEAAEARKAAAEAEQATVEARLAADKARLGIGVVTPTATPPPGTITGDATGKFIETQLLAEMSARKASRQMVGHLCNSQSAALRDKPIKALVITTAADKTAADAYQAILLQLRFFEEEYTRLSDQAVGARKLPEAAPTPTPGTAPTTTSRNEAFLGTLPLLVPAATQAVRSFADLLNMFRTDTEFKDQPVVVDTRMVMSFLAEELFKQQTERCKLEEVYQPAVYSLSIQGTAADGPIMVAYTKILQATSRGDGEVAENNAVIARLTKVVEAKDTEIAELKKQIADNTKKPDAKPPAAAAAATANGSKKRPPAEPPPRAPAFDLAAAKQKLAQAEGDRLYLNTKIERLRRTAANIEAFRTSITDALKLMTSVNTAGNETVLAGLLRAERLRELLNKENTYALDLAIRASGTNRFTRTAFFNTKVAHSGGVSLNLSLFNHLDQMVYGRQEGYYIEFSRSKDIRQRAGFQQLDPSFRQ